MTNAMDLPPAIAHYLLTLATQQPGLAYLQVSPEGHLLSSGGTLKQYGLDLANEGDAVEQHLLFLTGLFPHPPTNEVMPHIQTERGDVITVHFISKDSEQWILLLDATADLKRQQQFQQVANELTLLRQQVSKYQRTIGLSPGSGSP
ncbi:MAG: hypothetical protein AAF635_08160 [Cyanobacteria bacterium P01_C01_bin.69]